MDHEKLFFKIETLWKMCLTVRVTIKNGAVSCLCKTVVFWFSFGSFSYSVGGGHSCCVTLCLGRVWGAPKPRCQRQRGQEISNFEQKWNSCLSRRRCEEACMNIWMESLENARSCESPGSVSSIVVTTAKFCRALSEPTAWRHKPNHWLVTRVTWSTWRRR